MSIHTWHIVGVIVPYALFATALWGLASGAIKDAVGVGSLPTRIDAAVGRWTVRIPTVPFAYAMGFVSVAFVYGCVLDRTHMVSAIGADPHALAPGADAVLYGLAAASWLSAGLVTGGYGWLRRGTRALLAAAPERDRAEDRYRLLAEHLTDLVTHHTPDGRYEWVSASVEPLLGYAPADLVGTDPYALFHPDDVDRVQAESHSQLLTGATTTSHVRYRIRHADGHYLWFESLTEAITDATGALVGLQVSSHDVTEHKAIEDDLRHRAHYDPLTGLANRALLAERIEALTARAHDGGPGGQFAVLYVDLDRFKAINDTKGHAAGDAVLVEVARRVERTTRERDTVARIGGDEFAVLLGGVATEAEAVRAALRIEGAFEVPFLVDGAPRELSASIGIALGRPAHASASDVLREADLATYRAKARTRSAEGASWVVFTEDLQQAHDRRRRIEADLQNAIAREELCVAYQPLVDLETGTVCSVEALLRWHHPDLGLLGPGAFIDIAEETGRIGELDRWVLAEGLRQLDRWEAELGPLDLSLSVNCSAHDLDDPAFGDRIRVLAGDRADRIVLELTESTLIGDTEAAAAVLHGLAADGVRIAMDDFGTGYSSLSVVHALPIDEIKIDRAFVQRMHEDAAARGMVETVVGFARTLGAVVVAEGIETPSQLALLQQMGCDVGQGYLFARPLTPDAMRTLLTADMAWPISVA